MPDAGEIARRIKARALQLGFHDARIARADALVDDGAKLLAWLDAGRHGEMAYMAETPATRADPAKLLPGARSVVALACSYYRGEPPAPPEGGPHGQVARYAWGRDYHRVLGIRLRDLKAAIAELAPEARCRSFVDASPLLERAFARAAGLGFAGKNTMLIHHRLGSWIFLAAVLATLELPVDAIDTGDCGRCRLCLEACPTGAFVEPYVLDARRCISYWTIETATEPPPGLAARFGGRVFGCDACQEVCPYNQRPLDPRAGALFAGSRTAGAWLDAEELAGLDRAGFRKRFKTSPLTRPGPAGMARNARRVLRSPPPLRRA